MVKFSEFITESELVEKRTPSEKLDKEYKRQVAKKGTPLQKVLAYIGYKDPKLKKRSNESCWYNAKNVR